MATAGMFAAGLYLVPLAVGVSGCIAGERHRATLDSLLTTALCRRRILWSKVRAHTENGLVFGVGAITAVGCGFCADGGARLGLAAMAALTAAFAVVVALAAWLSVRCATPVRAFRLCLPAVIFAIPLPILVRNRMEWTEIGRTVESLTWIAAGCAGAARCCGGVPVRSWRSHSTSLGLPISTQSKLYGEFGSFSWRISSTGSCFSQPA